MPQGIWAAPPFGRATFSCAAKLAAPPSRHAPEGGVSAVRGAIVAVEPVAGHAFPSTCFARGHQLGLFTTMLAVFLGVALLNRMGGIPGEQPTTS